MLDKLRRAVLRKPRKPAARARIHESAELLLVSIHDLERRRMYERMAEHQRLIEIEDELHGRF